MPSAPSLHDDVTEPLPRLASDTKELPAAVDAPTEAVPAPFAAAPATEPAPPAPAPAAPAAPAPAAPPAPAPAARPAAPARRPAPARNRRTALAAAALALVAIAAGATAGTLLTDRGTGRPAPAASAGPQTRVDAKVSSLDPAGGSGFERRGDQWRTQTYRTAAFGGLKPGVGLVLDLGSPQQVATVTVEALTPGSTVGLRAADDAPTSGDLTRVGDDVTADGRTTLEADGGSHRYWVVWVSGLGPRGDGYGATFGTPAVTVRKG